MEERATRQSKFPNTEAYSGGGEECPRGIPEIFVQVSVPPPPNMKKRRGKTVKLEKVSIIFQILSICINCPEMKFVPPPLKKDQIFPPQTDF